MLVTDIVKKDNKKYIVFLDYSKAFSLYGSEIKKYDICIEKDISKTAYEQIMNEILPKRCMERAVYILKNSDKSSSDIRTKLIQGDYPEDIVEKVIDKLVQLSYLDDDRYAYNYIKYNVKSKSLKKIKNDLLLKGISKDCINNAVETYEEEYLNINDSQYELLKKEFLKKKFDFINDDNEKLYKIYSSLYRKGFKYDDIEKVYNDLKKSYQKEHIV